MTGGSEKGRRLAPVAGDIVLSILNLPLSFTCLKKYVADGLSASTALWLCAMFAAMGLARLFRAFRLREASRVRFVAQLVYAAAFTGCAALPLIAGCTKEVMGALAMTFWTVMLANRVIAIALGRKRWDACANVVLILIILCCMITAYEGYALIAVIMTATSASLLSVMGVAFARINLAVLKDVIRKTYAEEIILGLALLIVAFSYVLEFTDEAFTSFFDGLWYCFAVVTTIGFGDLTPTTDVGRILTIILGLYGIVVVSLITSIIVNFYGEMKKTEASGTAPGDGADTAPPQ